ncbi:TPA: TadE/TadG family type IV pilus assembly protein [Salmonella enterica subsp. enterica serovar Reading]|uniref:VWFA domain-containing protein n=1 Tax=Salmonella enterica TaxID=28901 RepID=A0A759QNH4_SALER|nr:hypothetical protein [Salmonella enterica]EBS3610826.1 hypothetical protein [Salmonella enterica subsp. enterica serovar Poona]EGB1030932.1 hypothetical protein [Salmonella enterica subsp. enterica serovar Reading]EGI5703756.1 hypothetical protein [Salmonella enterica subsp. enterica serovar Chester]HAG1890891.1 hypothetical protein [Salmonella enterica]
MRLQKLKKTLKMESGAVAVMAALAFPATILFISVGFDGAQAVSTRARLADALDQGVLAVAMMDNRNISQQDQLKNKEIVKNYLKYYLPGRTVNEEQLNVDAAFRYDNNGVTLRYVDYTAKGTVYSHPIFSKTFSGVGFSHNIDVRSDANSGIVRKSLFEKHTPTDYAIVVDFSESIKKNAQGQDNVTRLQLLQKVVTDFSEKVLSLGDTSKIAIVPYTVGVSVIHDAKNPAGGFQGGCSFLGKFKTKYSGFDFNFWYNKFGSKYSERHPLISTLPKEGQKERMDTALYHYYRDIVGPALRLDMNAMVSKGWCKKNPTGKPEYSCDADPYASLSQNLERFYRSIDIAAEFIHLTDKHLSIVNDELIDLEGTLEGNYMFKDENVTTFIRNVAPTVKWSKSVAMPFRQMCLSEKSDSNIINTISTFTKPINYLIELTSDLNVINQFKTMTLDDYASTDSSTALLRTMPVIAKGTNERKIVIVISDGFDVPSSKYDPDGPGPLNVTKKLHKELGFCEKIRTGLKKYGNGNTQEADIFFISILDKNGPADEAANAIKGLNFWSENCVGKNNAFSATDYEKLLNTLLGIAHKGRLNFISKDTF